MAGREAVVCEAWEEAHTDMTIALNRLIGFRQGWKAAGGVGMPSAPEFQALRGQWLAACSVERDAWHRYMEVMGV